MALREKYAYAIQTAKNLHFQGGAEERDGKLHFNGTVQTQDEANKIWDAIKTIPTWQQDIVANIRATGSAPAASGPATSAGAPAGAAQSERTYTVKSGDTLSRIAKEMLGDANAYTDIFNANRDQLSDPNKITPGQVLKIPAHAHR